MLRIEEHPLCHRACITGIIAPVNGLRRSGRVGSEGRATKTGRNGKSLAAGSARELGSTKEWGLPKEPPVPVCGL